MIPPRSAIHALLDGNAKWADAVDHAEPGFFRTSAQGQYPKVLWIGCADSRVPESIITGARPGDIFVHRNIANQFHLNDDSALAVLSYAIGVVGVEHVVIAGHTHCAGAAVCYDAVLASRSSASTTTTATSKDDKDDAHAHVHVHVHVHAPTETETETKARATSTEAPAKAQTQTQPETPLSRWLAPLKALIASLDLSSANATADPAAAALDLIVQENVKRQVEHVCAADPIREAWAASRDIRVHGWVYDVASGRIRDLEVSRGPAGRSA